MGSNYYDNVDGKGPTTWQMILRSENMRTFAAIDKDEDGYISREDLSKHLGNSKDVNELIEQADKNKDGKVDYQEFLEMLSNH
jgi:Ca2+-binding EF-hand superfamily protein